jgi:hypothetical protein
VAGSYEKGYAFSRFIKCAQFLTTSSFSTRALLHIRLPNLMCVFLRTEIQSHKEVVTAVTMKNVFVFF